jgi:hypothetical protein
LLLARFLSESAIIAVQLPNIIPVLISNNKIMHKLW